MSPFLSVSSGYDGGDCCECTCVSTSDYTCGEHGGYFCLDPGANCVGDDDVTTLSSYAGSCIDEFAADGDCDPINNNEGCGASRLVIAYPWDSDVLSAIFWR